MKYLNLIWKVLVWNLICFVGTTFVVSLKAGNSAFILLVGIIIGLPMGTIVGFVKYSND